MFEIVKTHAILIQFQQSHFNSEEEKTKESTKKEISEEGEK